ncbi:hypothetical protein FBEOM_4344 [Fusarium beomiforme]|uniref:Uncharacterized protein n=1 Tax=Fusarium beomiforme TaxID=44412 RepID=A0A9P5AMX5_9HYPO|nr:hypothetical protein FBEOM_4344 [Fusarium beomiforme]
MEQVEAQESRLKVLDRLFKTTKPSTIPHLTDLRKALGYGNPGQGQDIALKRAVRTQIESVVSSSTRIPAYRFTRWRSSLHQRGLQEVTKDFLDTKGKGPEFWPDSHHSSNTKWLQYSRVSTRIRRLMIKVFWGAAREYKRYKPSISTSVKLLSQSSDTDTQSLKPLNSSSNDKHQTPSNPHSLKGQSVDNPIDVETSEIQLPDMVPRDDPFAAYGMSFNFTVIAQREGTPDESSSSEPFSSSLLIPDRVGAIMPIPEEPDDTHSTDPYEVPKSQPRVTQAAQNNGKRSAEPGSDINNRQSKAPRQDSSKSSKQTRQPSKSTRGGRKTQSLPPGVRSSTRQRKPTHRPNDATEEQIRAAENPSPSPSPSPSPPPPPAAASVITQHGSYADKDQQLTASANYSNSENTAKETRQGQSSADAIRAEAARQAERQALEAAAAGVDRQPHIPNSSTTVLSAKAQEKLSDVSHNQTPTVQAGLNRKRESTVRPEARQEDTQSSNLVLDDAEKQAVDGCEIILRSNTANSVDFMSWRPSSPIFHMSLPTVAKELGLRPGQTLYVVFRGRDNLKEDLQSDDQGKFENFQYECLDHITKKHREAASTPVSQRRKLRYWIYFSDKPISI